MADAGWYKQLFSVMRFTSVLVVSPAVPAVPLRKPSGVPAPAGVGVHTVVGAVDEPLGDGEALPPVDPVVTVTE